MAGSTPYDEIKALLVAAAAPLRVLDYEEVEDAISQGDQPFLALADSGAYEFLNSVGAPQGACIREEGELAVHVFTLARDGFRTARAIVDQIRDAMRYRPITGGMVETVSPPLPLGAFNGLWNETRTDVAYRQDMNRAVA